MANAADQAAVGGTESAQAVRQATYCNPLPMPESGLPGSTGTGPRSLADPTVIKHEGKWYLYATGGQAWVSSDLVNWSYHPVRLPQQVVAPTIGEHDGLFYLAGNGAGALYRSRHPLGPWEDLGPILDQQGNRVHWVDLHFFGDDDGTFYCYHNAGSGVGADGVFVTVLDPKHSFTRAVGPTVNCFRYNPEHVWERWGDANEFPDIAWIEAPWVMKHNGRYYLSYSGCGTEWRRYAVGVYTSDSATGPWVYDDRSPILRECGGLLNGTGHHAMTIGPDGNWWMIYHVLFHQQSKWDRRLALDPVGFDAEGRMFMRGPTETPQFAPGVVKDPMQGNDGGLLPLAINKPITASSNGPGRTPDYAVDNHIRTWWEPADESLPQWLEVDLGGSFSIEASRIIFSMAGVSRRQESAPYGYRIEVSEDRTSWRTALDKTDNATARNVEYDQFAPARGRYVRLTITELPRQRRLGIIEFTAFGKAK